ncbi:MAG: ABC transporter substrate-binding protein [Methanoregula sp.]|uniref:ABC transporter substrate-binding protein n=1 Tax=Methanoregula sp. TaxID=2052170 RepID=UPI0025FD06A7|nr:ABC transporter substrate-binding protein [Methanoregula sp.]MCK9630586.1 ABC transporter substrate-binding protein [Methanoregula sp.]
MEENSSLKRKRIIVYAGVCIIVIIALCIAAWGSGIGNAAWGMTKNKEISADEVIIPVSSSSSITYTSNMQKGGVPPGIYQGLIIKDLNGTFDPALAKSWDISADAKTWTFHLARDAIWSDGVPFTCADVKFTNDYMKSNNLTLAYVLTDVQSIDCPDPSTAVVTLKTSYSGFLDQISRQPGITISPKHFWESIPDPQHYEDKQFIGTGPFVFDQDTAGYVRLLRNDAYYGKKAQISGVVLKVITNPDSQVLALKNSEIDVVSDISPAVAKSLKGEKDIAMYTIKDTGAYEVAFNLAQYPANITGFRKAMSHAVDRDTISSLFGTGRPTETTFLIPSLAGRYVNPEDVGMYTYNLSTAREILKSAGFTWDGKGLLLGPDGNVVTLTIPLGTKGQASGGNQKIVSVLKNDWEKLGITLSTVSYDDQKQYKKAINANAVFLDSFPVTLHDDADALVNFAVTPTQKTNYYNYNNPEYNALVSTIRNTADQQEILKMAYQMQDLLARDIPTVPVCTSDTIVAYRSDRFTGWDLGPGYYSVTDPRVLTNLTPVK